MWGRRVLEDRYNYVKMGVFGCCWFFFMYNIGEVIMQKNMFKFQERINFIFNRDSYQL